MREITRNGKKTTLKVRNYLRNELHVDMSDNNIKIVLSEVNLKFKVNQKKSKLLLYQVKARLKFTKCHFH